MSVVAVTDHAFSLAQAVDELLVLARNQAGGSCVWCGSRNLTEVRSRDGSSGDRSDTIVLACRDCGSELTSEKPFQVRDRWA